MIDKGRHKMKLLSTLIISLCVCAATSHASISRMAPYPTRSYPRSHSEENISPPHFVSLGTMSKTPAEAFNCAVSFPLASLDGITMVSVTATDTQTGDDVTANIIAVSPAPAISASITANGATQVGQFALFRVTGGTNNERVLIDVVVMDNVTGETFDGQMNLNVLSGLAH